MGLSPDLALELTGVGQKRLYLREQLPAELGQLDTPSRTYEQAGVALALQGVHLPAQNRLRTIEDERRPRQAAELGDGHECPPLVQVRHDVELDGGRSPVCHPPSSPHASQGAHGGHSSPP
jgi:hypothetical protein